MINSESHLLRALQSCAATRFARTGFAKTGLAAAVLGIVCCGCGEEDFSAPPADLAEIRARAKAKTEERLENQSDKSAARVNGAGPQSADGAAALKPASDGNGETKHPQPNSPANTNAKTADSKFVPKSAAPEQSGDTAAAGVGNRVLASSGVTDPASATKTPGLSETSSGQPAEAAAAETPSPRNRDVAASVEGEVTVGGKTTAQLKADKEKNESVGAAGMSLLEKLRADNDTPEEKKSVGRRKVREEISRTGRFAIAAQTWLQLQNQLAKRFYVAATQSGNRIAASSGERSLGVLSTQVELLGEKLTWERRERTVAAVRGVQKEIVTQPVTGLPATLSAVELIQNGDVVLIGTADGRLIARSSANLQNWDVYAQDLFAFQDEHRPATKISDSAVVAVRVLDAEHLLTITEDGECLIWRTTDVVHTPVSPLDMTEEQAKSPEAPVLQAESLHHVDIPKSVVLNLQISDSGEHGIVITSDEHITVFASKNGRVVADISPVQLDDTQPVTALLEEDLKRVLIGLADGRIIRRALPGGTPISGVDNAGRAVDYETVFAPDLRDNSGAVTAMSIKHDGGVLYIGRLNGYVTRFDLPRKQLLRSDLLHKGPVIEIRSTRAGVLTIGTDRVAKLSDTPDPVLLGGVAETFRLPTDAVLNQKVIIEPEESAQDKFTIRRNFDAPVTSALKPSSLVGIRPPNPVLALYEHQLRIAADSETRTQIRKKILDLQTDTETAADREYVSEQPTLQAEVPTEFDFQSRPLRRVVMSLSHDSLTVAAAQYYKGQLMRDAAPDQPIIVWDTLSGTTLRTWRRSRGVFELQLDVGAGLVLPQPLSARMELFSGRFMAEEHRYLSAHMSHSGEWYAVGLAGPTGMAADVVTLIETHSAQRLTGVEAFEGAATAIAWSPDDKSVFVNVRDRTQSRLLELEGRTLQLRAELAAETLTGAWDVDRVDLEQGVSGATHILPSPQGRYLVTYGKYGLSGSAFQLRIWKKSGDRWPQDDVKVIESREGLTTDMTDTPMRFVNQQDSLLAVIGPRGLGLIDTRTGSIRDNLELPDVGGRRPVTLLSPDGRWLLGGDEKGQVWIWELRSLKRKPLQFEAQAGPITGLAMSEDSHFLVTAGEENRIRVWDVAAFLAGPAQSAQR